MNGVVSDIVRREQPVRTHLPLDAEIPLIEVGGLEIQRMIDDAAEGLEGGILAGVQRERISAGVVHPRIRKVRASRLELIAKGLVLRNEVQTESVLPVVEHPIGGADGHTAIALGIPNHSNAR